MTTPELHEFVPFPVPAQDKPGHVCKGGCACRACSRRKGDRAIHYQARDRRRPKVAPETESELRAAHGDR